MSRSYWLRLMFAMMVTALAAGWLSGASPASASSTFKSIGSSSRGSSSIGRRAGARACAPSISGYTTLRPSSTPGFAVYGTCFGTKGAYQASDAPYFRVTDFGTATIAQARQVVVSEAATKGAPRPAVTAPGLPASVHWWNACNDNDDPMESVANAVTCTVSRWSNSEVKLADFNGDYVGYGIKRGDTIAVQVWNSQTLNGPAVVYFAAGSPGTTSAATGANPEVSSIASSLPAPGHAFSNISSDIVDALITLALALFLTFPSNVFNATFQENYADILAWWQKWLDVFLPPPVRRAFVAGYQRTARRTLSWLKLTGGSQSKVLQREQANFTVVLVAGALLGTLLDPSFGPNGRTVLSFIAILVAMAAGVAISGAVTSGYHRAAKHGKVPYKFEALPVGLLVAAACVVISRASGFDPGYLYGVVCGVTFGRELAQREEGHLVAISSIVKVALAILAWLAWDAITDHAEHRGSFFGVVLVDDFLASLFVSSLVGTVIGLFPLRFLPGHKLKSWHRGVWAGTFGVTLFVLVQVLLRPHSTSSGPSHAPLVTTICLFVLFGVASLVFRDHFARKHKRLAAVAIAGEEIGEEEIGGEGLAAEGLAAEGLGGTEIGAGQ